MRVKTLLRLFRLGGYDICMECGSVVPARLAGRHASMHTLIKSQSEVIKTLASAVKKDGLETHVKHEVAFLPVKYADRLE